MSGILAQDRDFLFLSGLICNNMVYAKRCEIVTYDDKGVFLASTGDSWCMLCCIRRLEPHRAVQDFGLARFEKRCKQACVFSKLASKYAETSNSNDDSRISSRSTGFGRTGQTPSHQYSGPDGLAAVLVGCVGAGRTGNQCLRCGVRSFIGQCLAQVRSVGRPFKYELLASSSLKESCLCFL